MFCQLFLLFSLGATSSSLADNAYRTWTSKTGDAIVAQYIRSEGKYIVLRQTNGKDFKIALAALSEADQAFLKDNILPIDWEQIILGKIPKEIAVARARYAAQELEAARSIVADIDKWVDANRPQLIGLTQVNSRLARATLSLLNQSYKSYIWGIGQRDDAGVATRNQQVLLEQQAEPMTSQATQTEHSLLNNTSIGDDEENDAGLGGSSKTRADAGGMRSFSGDSDGSYSASRKKVTPINTNPLAAWNDPVKKDDPLAPHNNLISKHDPTKPRNQSTGGNEDLNAEERKAYGLPTYPKNKDPFAAWNDPINKNSHFAPHNNSIEKTSPFKPWNQPFGKNEDLNAEERKAYGLPTYPKNKDPFAAWNDPINKNSHFAPHNNSIEKTSPFKPWNQPFGKNEDLNAEERRDYGLPPLKPQY